MAMDQDLLQMQTDIRELKEQVGKMYTALMGSDIAKDGGLVGRIIELEKDNDQLKQKIEVLEKEKSRNDIYVRVMWGALGSIATGVLAYVLSLIFKH